MSENHGHLQLTAASEIVQPREDGNNLKSTSETNVARPNIFVVNMRHTTAIFGIRKITTKIITAVAWERSARESTPPVWLELRHRRYVCLGEKLEVQED